MRGHPVTLSGNTPEERRVFQPEPPSVTGRRYNLLSYCEMTIAEVALMGTDHVGRSGVMNVRV